jgi:hypothetical protein
MLSECIADENVDHEALLKQVFDQFPSELSALSTQFDWAVARGGLWKGIRAIIWGREADGRAHFARAVELGAGLDESLMQLITYHLLGYETEFGTDAVMRVLSVLSPFINQVAGRGGDRLEASYLINRAFDGYRGGAYKRIPAMVMRAWQKDPSYVGNRGVLSIFLRSLVKNLS